MVHFLIALMSCLDFGNYGEVFPPHEEEDILIILQKRLRNSGVGRIKETFASNTIPKAKRMRSLEFDPSIYLSQGVQDHHGNTLIPKGARVNLLEITSLSEDLLFLDGDDPLQVAWAKQEKGMWILINGNQIELEKQELKPVYFDQDGYLANKLGVSLVPSKVSQNGKKLVIEEIPCF